MNGVRTHNFSGDRHHRTGSKSNYHAITTTTAPEKNQDTSKTQTLYICCGQKNRWVVNNDVNKSQY